jgi:hypothetical protein
MSKTLKTALFFSALLGLAVTQPLASSFAASPNAITNQTAQAVTPTQVVAQPQQVKKGTGGVYDRYDVYRDAKGFPLPGEAQLFQPIN